jgi:hypothetical protein
MSSSDFVKGACQHCAGHLEFPAEAAGQTAPCPHCGQPTRLVAAISSAKSGISRQKRLAIAVALCACAAVPATILVTHRTVQGGGTGAKAPETTVSNAPVATTPKAPPEPQPEAQTNDFAIMPYKLEKTPGSSLVYIIGSIRNLSSQQRFGVKLAFTLFDDSDNPIGSATDYQATIDPHGVWHFKAMVMASKTASAKFDSIAEDK